MRGMRRTRIKKGTIRSIERIFLFATISASLCIILWENKRRISLAVGSNDSIVSQNLNQFFVTHHATSPENMHKLFPQTCIANFNASIIPQYSYQLYDIVNGPRKVSEADIQRLPTNFSNVVISKSNGHSQFQEETLTQRVHGLAVLQTCLYESISRFNSLAKEYGITRWAGHGGSAMSAVCSHSMNLWDDDIDVTVDSCVEMNRIYHSRHDVFNSQKGFVGKLLPNDDDWILYKKQFPNAYRFKLKPRTQLIVAPNDNDVSGLDIMCFDQGITSNEVVALNKSGFRDYCECDPN